MIVGVKDQYHPVVAPGSSWNRHHNKMMRRNQGVSDLNFAALFPRVFFEIVLARMCSCILAKPFSRNLSSGFTRSTSVAV
jgi:hypothetical protein